MTVQDTRPVTRLLDHLPGHRASGAGWEARCPAHDDRHASLSITEGDDGRALLKCHAGCDSGDVLIAIGLTFGDLFPRASGNGDLGGLTPTLEATYDYVDANRQLVAQKVRFFPKDFRLRRPDGRGGWVWNLKGVAPPLYNLPEVRMARAEQLPVWVAEGEKDCDALGRRGEIATTNIGGAGKWPSQGAADELTGVDVVIVADKDPAGRKHALDVARSVAPVAGTLRVVESDRAKDAFDHFARSGGFDDFVDVDWWPEAATPAPPPPEPPPAGLIKASSVQPTRVRWLWPGWLPRRKISLLDGDPGVGKSVLALELVARVTYGGAMPGRPGDERVEPANVLLLTAEDGFDDTTVPRLMAAGADRERVFWLPEVPWTDSEGRVGVRPPEIPADAGVIASHVRAHSIALIVVDVLMAFMGGGVNTWRDSDVRRALAPMHQLADENGCVVLLLRHLTKGSAGGPALYRGGGSIGLAAAARSVLMAGRDPRKPDATNAFVLAPGKENLSQRSRAVAYELRPDPMYDVPRVHWQGHTDVTAEDLAAWHPPKAGQSTQTEDAAAWLSEYLSDGPVEWNELRRDAIANGFSESTLRRGATSLCVVVRRVGKGRKHRSTWGLPDA